MKMDNPNEVQPIDCHVQRLLESAVKKYHIHVKNLDKPTRGERLEAALAMNDEQDGILSAEIMIGRALTREDDSVHFMLMMRGMSPQDPRTFYDGFAHQYWPGTKR